MADKKATGGDNSSARRTGNARSAARRPAGYPGGGRTGGPSNGQAAQRRRTEPRQVASTGRRELVRTRAELRTINDERREKEWQSGVERVRGGVDKIMLALVILLVTLGAIMVFSASYPTGLSESGDGFKYLKKHLRRSCRSAFTRDGDRSPFTGSRSYCLPPFS